MEEVAFDLECALLKDVDLSSLQHVFSTFEDNSKSVLQDYTEELILVVKCIIQGDFTKVLKQPTAQLLLRDISITEEKVEKFVSIQDPSAKLIRQLLLLSVGLSCLKLFIQQNWLGPTLNKDQRDQLPLPLQLERADVILLSLLSCETENIYELASLPAIYLVAQNILCHSNLDLCKTAPIWAVRCLYCHQMLLDEHSVSLKTEIMANIERMKCLNDLLEPKSQRSLVCEIDLELSHIFLFYYEYDMAKEHLQKAKSSIGVEVNFSVPNTTNDVLPNSPHWSTLLDYLSSCKHLSKNYLCSWKRTYFQNEDYSQLKLEVKVPEKEESDIEEHSCDTSKLPKDMLLGDDTVMPHIKFLEEQNVPKLQSSEQAVIISLCYTHMKSNALFSLTVEELIAYITCLLNQPTNWCIQTLALHLRSKLEKDKLRKVERSMTQLQSLVDQVGMDSPSVASRLKFYHCVPVPPKWLIEKDLAILMLVLGSLNSALEIFLRLEMWDEAIECYLQQGRYEKAENMIREQLDKNESPKLWCVLGDVTKDISYYEKAWELSGYRSARAQKSIGFFHLRAGRFEECIPHFQKSLAINSMQVPVWFSLGCAAMKTNNFTLATSALYRCVGLDPENGEAWNNLSSVLITTGKISKAFHTLQEALKAEYDNWRMWENFLVVSTEVGEFEKAISAYHRLMDLKDKFTDIQREQMVLRLCTILNQNNALRSEMEHLVGVYKMLTILVKVITTDQVDKSGRKVSRLKPQLLKLMGRVTSCVTGDARIWILYHDLCHNGETEEDKDKALQFLIKAHRISSQDQACEKEARKCKQLIQLTLDLSKEFIEAGGRRTSEAVQLLSSAKLSIKSLVTKTKKNFTDIEGQLESSLVEPLAELESQLEHILTLIAEAKNS